MCLLYLRTPFPPHITCPLTISPPPTHSPSPPTTTPIISPPNTTFFFLLPFCPCSPRTDFGRSRLGTFFVSLCFRPLPVDVLFKTLLRQPFPLLLCFLWYCDVAEHDDGSFTCGVDIASSRLSPRGFVWFFVWFLLYASILLLPGVGFVPNFLLPSGLAQMFTRAVRPRTSPLTVDAFVLICSLVIALADYHAGHTKYTDFIENS